MIDQLINCFQSALVALKNAFLTLTPCLIGFPIRGTFLLIFFKYFFLFFSITSSFFPPCWSEATRGLEFMMKEDVIEPRELTTGKSEFKLWQRLPFIIKPWSFIFETMDIVRILRGDVVKITEYISVAFTSLRSYAEINVFPNAFHLNEGTRSGKQLSPKMPIKSSCRNKVIRSMLSFTCRKL